MPRPRKCRRICSLPRYNLFTPAEPRDANFTVTLTVDEFETIRLIDHEGLLQEECGKKMQIARTTVQLIYSTARKKLAEALVNGANIEIKGGDYQLCSQEPDQCCCPTPCSHRACVPPA